MNFLQNLLDSWIESIVAHSKTEKQGQRDSTRRNKLSNSKADGPEEGKREIAEHQNLSQP